MSFTASLSSFTGSKKPINDLRLITITDGPFVDLRGFPFSSDSIELSNHIGKKGFSTEHVVGIQLFVDHDMVVYGYLLVRCRVGFLAGFDPRIPADADGSGLRYLRAFFAYAPLEGTSLGFRPDSSLPSFSLWKTPLFPILGPQELPAFRGPLLPGDLQWGMKMPRELYQYAGKVFADISKPILREMRETFGTMFHEGSPSSRWADLCPLNEASYVPASVGVTALKHSSRCELVDPAFMGLSMSLVGLDKKTYMDLNDFAVKTVKELY